jgi:drug/metabolite transporter (DMT)-like permease
VDLTLLWIPATVIAAAAQTARNTMQHRLTDTLGTIGATQVRFLYGLPFSVVFLALVLIVGGESLPAVNWRFAAFVAAAAVTQIAATALMLATMQLRSFALSTVYIKTEPLQVAVFGVVVLGDHLSVWGACAVIVATSGVVLMSLKGRNASLVGSGWRPALLGIASGAGFALSSVGFRGAVLSLESGSFVLRATSTLVAGLVLQTIILVVWLLVFKRDVLLAIVRAWRSSLMAGCVGAVASQFWYIAFALTATVNVRTLGLLEVLFAQIVSRRVFAQTSTGREKLGVGLVLVGVLLLLVSTSR